MNILRIKKTTTKNVRDVIYDERALKKAAKESIKDQKQVTKKATKLRTQLAR
jgi:hypothetical protein